MLELLDRYHHKIKSAQELRDIVGTRPRQKRVIMCHGVFDVVHPGHIRHLLYAKNKADILIASITADRHITKGTDRPHVPQDLRAVNLAAFEAVDYVVIDKNAKPLENIRIIEPDYFAKGFEYTAGSMSDKTAEEAGVVQSYGGEIIFTPGDIVYSSSNLIDLAPPVLKFEKLQIVMERYGLTFDKLRRALDDMSGRRVHVVGDTIVDSYTHCAMFGGQTKTPTISVLFERKVDYVGGAAIVAKHLASAGGRVTFSTVLGDDSYRDFVIDDLKSAGIDVRAVVDRARPTVNKNAIVADGYRLLKIDTIDNRSISDPILEEIAQGVRNTATDAVVFADFRHGIFNRRTIPDLVQALPPGCFRAADSQVASRWGNITDFQGFDLITPNEREARFALGDQDSGIRPLASNLYDASRCKLLILKLGARGVLTCCNEDHESLDNFFVVDSFVERLADAVGAGDALLAYVTLAMLASRDPAIATILGSMAAAVECECNGNIPVTADDVRAKIDSVERQLGAILNGMPMRVVVAGLGVQGQKRRRIAGDDFVAAIDPVNREACYRSIQDVPLADYDAALVCIPDDPKIDLLTYCLENGKHVLVEKPLFASGENDIVKLEALARKNSVVCYTAYNHRFEPHYVRMRDLLASGELGKVYSCRMFYGNGTARLVRESAWRDRNAGVLPDLGSHLLDTCRFWFGDIDDKFQFVGVHSFENRAPDHVVVHSEHPLPRIELEMTLLMWRNHFTCDVLAEHGSAHIESLCKWGPSVFNKRTRVLPSGPPLEETETLPQGDPTWALEYAHFKRLCSSGVRTDLSNDVWLHRVLTRLGHEAMAPKVAR